MTGLGTLVNMAAVVDGGLLGLAGGRFFTEKMQKTLLMANAVAVLFIGIGGAMQGMLHIKPDGTLGTQGTMMMIASMAIGALLGEIINLEDRMEEFGVWLKKRTGSEGDAGFVNGFVTASLTVCIGAMAIIGAIQDSLQGDYTILFAKSVLDCIIIMVMTASMGKGCIFSAIPIGILQGSVTVLAGFLAPVMTEAALANLSYIGSILIFCVGLNLVFGPKVRVANLLPALVIAVLWALYV